MKLSTNKEHRDFFYKNGWIEFEEFLSEENVEPVSHALDQVLLERLHSSEDQLRYLSPEKLYLQGRDVWRSNAFLHKLAIQVRFAEIASELMEKKPLRLAYDQFIPTFSKFQTEEESREIAALFFQKTASLETVSCIKGIICGLIFALEDQRSSDEPEVLSEGVDIFPKKRGNAIYFKPDLLVNWKNLFVHSGQRFYLIVYTAASSFYILQSQDPNTHTLKRLGYIFNDKLNDRLHPIVYR